jgi:hypothetical protein
MQIMNDQRCQKCREAAVIDPATALVRCWENVFGLADIEVPCVALGCGVFIRLPLTVGVAEAIAAGCQLLMYPGYPPPAVLDQAEDEQVPYFVWDGDLASISESQLRDVKELGRLLEDRPTELQALACASVPEAISLIAALARDLPAGLLSAFIHGSLPPA